VTERPDKSTLSPASIDWDQLRIFHAVVETGSFTRAGHRLNISQSSISRQIAALERLLRASLFHRHSSGLVLTESGKNFEQTVIEIYERMAKGLAQIDEYRALPKGPLKITTSVAFGSAWLTSRMTKFRTAYPDIAISLLLADIRELDLSLSEADVAIRFASQTQPNLIQRHLLTVQFRVYASKEYIARRGAPIDPSELDQHEIIVYGDDMPAPVTDLNWLLSAGRSQERGPREAALRVSSVFAILKAIQSGLGIGALPYYLCEEGGSLVQVLPELEGPLMDAYLVYPEELRHSRRIAALRKFLIEEARRDTKAVRITQTRGQ
jgi:DNA-binding transcriptional LysR family regulator